MRRQIINFARSACLLVFSTGPATASTMYAVDTVTNNLLAVDTSTGTGTIIGDTGFDTVISLAFDFSGTLYGYDATTGDLISLDTSTGAGTSVASVSTSGANTISGMTFDPSGTTLFHWSLPEPVHQLKGLRGSLLQQYPCLQQFGYSVQA